MGKIYKPTDPRNSMSPLLSINTKKRTMHNNKISESCQKEKIIRSHRNKEGCWVFTQKTMKWYLWSAKNNNSNSLLEFSDRWGGVLGNYILFTRNTPKT